MSLPKVVIVGRPNVGKSSLLNALAGEMISIVEPTPGVTRDRISTIIAKDDKYFELIDTGGYGIVDSDHLAGQIEEQIDLAIESADLAIFMVDIREGLTPLDKRIAQLLRRHSLETIPVANKADTARMFAGAAEFSTLGFGDFLCISVENNLNKAVLVDRIFERIGHLESARPVEPVMKIAVVGKRNAGKSTLVNAIVGSERVIVSETPGTTRDSVDVSFEKDGRTIVIIDTAGARKKSKITDSIEFYGYVRARRSIHRADVVLFLIDATVSISQVDKKLARFIGDEHRSCIIVVNKWDLAKDSAVTDDYARYLTKVLPGLKFAPICFTTATEGKNIQSTLDLAAEIFKQTITWIPTAKLNKAFEMIRSEMYGVGKRKTGRPRIYYAAQIGVNPVTILVFVNRTDLFGESHRRFIIGRLRELLPIEEVPIRLLMRPRRVSDSAPTKGVF